MIYEKALSDGVIGCAITVHKEIGEGCLEKVYEKALCVEFDYQGIKYRTQVPLPVIYRGQIVGDYIADLIVEGKILLELKACSSIVPVHEAQLINYLKLSGLKVGYILNFGYPGALKFKRLVR
ncbi:MAG: GxxExxY protein [Candidatus Cloacimonetes bacterium]|nr:GxxExxY protein [Candidatus Cloacimonadota bacterium]